MPAAARTVAVVGGGPGGLMAAEVLARGGAAVTVYERMPSVGRKLLLAGRGGLNLTHVEPLDTMLARYGEARERLAPAIRSFPPAALREWSHGLGQPTFVGSTDRVFPQAFQATPLLRAWLARLTDLKVTVAVRHTWCGWTESGALRLERADGSTLDIEPMVTVLALGGGSWPRVGSDGRWVDAVRDAGIGVAPLRPANCGFVVDWSPSFAATHAGTPLKNLRISLGGDSLRGEAVITNLGIEGGVIYGLSALIRDRIERVGTATIHLDLHPDRREDDLAGRLSHRRPRDSLATHLRRAAGLSRVQVALIRECTSAIAISPNESNWSNESNESNESSGRDEPDQRTTDPDATRPIAATQMARLIKAVPVTMTGTSGIERAISTAGGITLDEIDEHWMLRRRPGVFVAGEMLDWEAPTGGYLLQATFSTAVAAAAGALAYLQRT